MLEAAIHSGHLRPMLAADFASVLLIDLFFPFKDSWMVSTETSHSPLSFCWAETFLQFTFSEVLLQIPYHIMILLMNFLLFSGNIRYFCLVLPQGPTPTVNLLYEPNSEIKFCYLQPCCFYISFQLRQYNTWIKQKICKQEKEIYSEWLYIFRFVENFLFFIMNFFGLSVLFFSFIL